MLLRTVLSKKHPIKHSYIACLSFSVTTLDSVIYFAPQHLPNFGPYKKEKLRIVSEHKRKLDLLDKTFEPQTIRPAVEPKIPVPKLKVMPFFVFSLFYFHHSCFFYSSANSKNPLKENVFANLPTEVKIEKCWSLGGSLFQFITGMTYYRIHLVLSLLYQQK